MVFLKVNLRKSILGLLGVCLITGGLSGCSNQVSTKMLEVGDCFNANHQILTGAQVATITTQVPCSDAHNSEVIGKHSFMQKQYANTEELAVAAEKICIEDFKNYHGISYQDTAYDLYPIFPSQKTWEQNKENHILCIALHLPPTTGSLKQSK